MEGNPPIGLALTAAGPFASMGDRKKTLAERVRGMKPSHRKGFLAALLELAVGAVALVTIGVTGFDGKLLVLGGLFAPVWGGGPHRRPLPGGGCSGAGGGPRPPGQGQDV